MRSFWLTTLVVVVLAVAAVALAYKSNNDPVLRALAIGALASLLTGLTLGGVEFTMNRRQREMLNRLEPILRDLEKGSSRFQGDWLKVHVSARSVDDPNKFWLLDRLRREECYSVLTMVGRSHRSMFEEVTEEQEDRLVEAMKRVAKQKGHVRIILLETAHTVGSIEDFLRKRLTKKERRNVHLLLLDGGHPLVYSALMNDRGVWLIPRLNALGDDKEIMVAIEREDSHYYYELFASDLSALERPFCREIDLCT